MEIIDNKIMGEINPIETIESNEIVIDNCLFYMCISPDELERLEKEAALKAKKLQEKWKRYDMFGTVINAFLFSLLVGMLALMLINYLLLYL